MPREQWLARAERHGADRDDDLVEQPSVVELSDQVAAADKPEILAASGRGHGCMNWVDCSLDKSDVRARNRREGTSCKDPQRLPVGPSLFRGCPELDHVPEHPLIRAGAHCQGTYTLNEPRVAGVANIAKLKEPFKGVIDGRDESVKAGRGVVLGLQSKRASAMSVVDDV